jgi:hypothetical protein
MLSSGVDPVTFPYLMAFFVKRFKEDPSDFLFGAIYNRHLDAPGGMAVWDPMVERIQVLFLSLFLPVEQMATGLVVLNLFLNAFFMLLLARALGIPRPVSWGMGAAWAFNAYTRATAKVFMGLTGVFHLPLVFLGLFLLAKGQRHSIAWAALAFLLVAFMPHYYLVVLALMTPLLVAFALALRPAGKPWRSYLPPFLGSALPAVGWLVFCLLFPLAPSHEKAPSPFPQGGKARAEEAYHPFLNQFAASPLDYLAGDVGAGERDLIPAKQELNREIIENDFGGQHTQDRAVGVRWLILLLAFLAALALLPSSRHWWKTEDRRMSMVFLAFGALSFWFALPPDWPVEKAGGSYWVYQLVPQVRTPSRAGIGVGFAALMLTGLFLKNLFTHWRWRPVATWAIGLLFSTLVVVELAPLHQDLPLWSIQPRYPVLTTGQECGLGLHYPYVSLNYHVTRFFSFLQRMRGSSCDIINATGHSPFDKKMAVTFGGPQSSPVDQEKFARFAECASLQWVVIGHPFREPAARLLCQNLGWEWKGEGVCLRAAVPAHGRTPATCLESP